MPRGRRSRLPPNQGVARRTPNARIWSRTNATTNNLHIDRMRAMLFVLLTGCTHELTGASPDVVHRVGATHRTATDHRTRLQPAPPRRALRHEVTGRSTKTLTRTHHRIWPCPSADPPSSTSLVGPEATAGTTHRSLVFTNAGRHLRHPRRSRAYPSSLVTTGVRSRRCGPEQTAGRHIDTGCDGDRDARVCQTSACPIPQTAARRQSEACAYIHRTAHGQSRARSTPAYPPAKSRANS